LRAALALPLADSPWAAAHHRYLDAMAIVSQSWAARAKAQAASGGSDGGGFM